jgi:F0F1-type ATP synthase delta subunit
VELKKRTGHASFRIASALLKHRQPGTAFGALTELLQNFKAPTRRNFLRTILGAVRRQLAFSQCVVEYAGTLSPEERQRIEHAFSAQIPENCQLSFHKTPSLLAGIRVCVGDQRWEFSLNRAIQQFLAD